MTLCFAIWFLVVENDSPGLSFAIALIGMPLLLLLFGFSKASRAGITKDGKAAGWVAAAIALIGVAYVAAFFADWLFVAFGWLVSQLPALISSMISETAPESSSEAE